MLRLERGTVVTETLGFSQIPIVGSIQRRVNSGTLPARKAQCVYCSDKAITFLGSAFPKLRFGINIAFVRMQYRGDRKP